MAPYAKPSVMDANFKGISADVTFNAKYCERMNRNEIGMSHETRRTEKWCLKKSAVRPVGICSQVLALKQAG